MSKFKITLDLDHEAPQDEIKRLIECWLHSQCDAEIEVEDPNTGDIIGTISFSSSDFKVES